MLTLWSRQGFRAIGSVGWGHIAAVANLVSAGSSLLFSHGTVDVLGTKSL